MPASSDDSPRVIDLEALRGEGNAPVRSRLAGVLDTSEVRWFAFGSPPSDVEDWFTTMGKAGTLERRCDVYQLHRLHDIGVKRRYRDTLEVKVRRAIGETLELEPGLAAPFEEWRKWCPDNNDPMAPSPDVPWIDIDKEVLTRTFMLDDGEVVGPAEHTDDTVSGCDVEIATVTIGGLRSWSFAFEAFGPKPDRRRAVTTSWELLIADSGRFENLGAYFDQAAGYPEWLDLVASELDAASGDSMEEQTG